MFPARLFGRKEKTNARIEVFLLRELNKDEGIWDVIFDPARKVRIGKKIYFDDGKIWCEVIDNTTSRGRTVRFNTKADLFKIIERIGLTPLPYYIKRAPEDEDKESYQTIFAKEHRLRRGPDRVAALHEAVGLGHRGEGREVRARHAPPGAGEGLLLDPVYTGKAMAGLIGLGRAGRFSRGDTVVFLHTGGLPGLFAYPELFPAAG